VYDFDPEIAPFAGNFPARDLTDPSSARLPRTVRAAIDGDEVRVEDHYLELAGSPEPLLVRLYRPAQESGTLPCLLQFHAGGFVIGSIDQEHERNRRLCLGVHTAVVAVEYRLAPEHSYPAALTDSYAALCWVAANAQTLGVDPARIALHGRSAGGGLAVSTALLARDQAGPELRFLYLAAPQLDDRCNTGSMRRFDDTPLWTATSARRSWAMYLGPGPAPGDPLSSYAVPARAGDLSGLPPTYLAVMEFDPLRDEAIAFAQSLTAADVRTELHLFPGTFHCSGVLIDSEISRRERAEELTALRRGLKAFASEC
jgi:acetyl esterase